MLARQRAGMKTRIRRLPVCLLPCLETSCLARFCLAIFCLTTCTAHAGSAAERIRPDNVGRLALVWTYDTHEPTERLGRGRSKPPAFEATPVYVGGRLYFSSPLGTVAALDAESGKEVWRIDLAVSRDTRYSDPANRGPTVRGNHLYVGTIDARLVCLEILDGRRCPGFGSNGEIDLTKGLRHAPQWAGEYGLTSAPAVYRDLVIVGSSVADNSRAQMASGEVRAFDARTGALRWTWHPLPENSGAGGANAWSRIVVDEQNALVFVPTGSASPDYFGGERPGNNEHANSIVALNAATGEVAWHFQTVHHDLWDYDVASPPLLYPGSTAVSMPGAPNMSVPPVAVPNSMPAASVPAVAVGSKTGHLFLFNRLTGAPLFPIVERAVPTSGIPGEHASPTQPFPSKPTSLALQQMSERDLWGPTPADLEACRRTFRELRNDGVFTPPSVKGTLNLPGNIGGLHWGGIAWDAHNRLLIAPVNRLPAIIRLIPRAEFDSAARTFPSRETTEQNGTPYSMSREFFLSPLGLPCIAPPWGELVAIHADSGELAWRVPLGKLNWTNDQAPRASALATPAHGPLTAPIGSPNLGGPATTDTGLVFIGATLDPYLRAFDTRTGRELWNGPLPTSARATPLIYVTPSGRHMVAMAAGGHDTPLSRIDTQLVVFALPR